MNRVWADGEEVSVHDLNMRIYKGAEDQVPDPVIEATEGAGMAPAYRGTAYVVFEDLELEAFGNRVPQFSFEVSRPDQIGTQAGDDPAKDVRAVAMIPGTGEYALATTPVHYLEGPGQRRSANVNSPAGVADFSASLRSFENELPRSEAASLVVCWFGDDLRCSSCLVQPKVENKTSEGENMPWSVAGLDRAVAEAVSTQDGRPVYGGTPTDASVLEAIAALHDAGKEVMFYPFILMEQLAGNGLPDPWGGAEQAALPWRGRISLDIAPNEPGSVDGTTAAEAQVEAFFGTARASDFAVVDEEVVYTGPEEWSFSRFILHYAALCALALNCAG